MSSLIRIKVYYMPEPENINNINTYANDLNEFYARFYDKNFQNWVQCYFGFCK